MRAALARLRAFLGRPQVQKAIDLAIIGYGLSRLAALLKEHEERLGELEERGLVPLDDLVTLRDLEKVEGDVRALQEAAGAPGDAAGEDAPA